MFVVMVVLFEFDVYAQSLVGRMVRSVHKRHMRYITIMYTKSDSVFINPKKSVSLAMKSSI